MSVKNTNIIHNKTHTMETRDEIGLVEKRSINITILKDLEGYLIIKLRDVNSFVFNYTSVIQRNHFQQMKVEQSLDIDFDEFETHLLEMLSSNVKGEMLLKLELNSEESKYRLVFYEKSRIKSLIFLTIEMEPTNQKELLEEMEKSMKKLQETNKNLYKQIESLDEKLKLSRNQLVQQRAINGEIEQSFIEDLQNLRKVFLFSLKQCESLLTEKVMEIYCRIVKVISDICIVKNENHLKSESSARLLQSMENLRLETVENGTVINRLRTDCAHYEKLSRELENQVFSLTQSKNDYEKRLMEMQHRMDEYRKDLESSAVAIAKKTELYNELKQDMEQANQVIKNYNKHYDMKAQEVEELMEVIKSKDILIKEQIFQNNQLFKEYHEYKARFNSEEMDRLFVEISTAREKIETLEKEKRELAKLNGLLTKKISSSSLFGDPGK